MKLNSEDLRQEAAERDASPVRFRGYQDGFYHQQPALSRAGTATSASSSPASSVQFQEIGTTSQPRSGIPRSGTQSTLGGNVEGSNTSPLSLRRTQTDTINSAFERHPTALERIETYRRSHAATVGRDYDGFGRTSTTASKKSKPLPDFGAGKPYPPPLPDKEEYVVEFCGPEDPLHPQNWPLKKKLGIGAVLVFTSISATLSSAIMSDSENTAASMYGVSEEVGTLCTSLFVLGYAVGPIVWAPMSELYGRKLPIVIASFGFSVFTIGVATAENWQTIVLCRFFAGSFGSAPLVLVAAIFSDLFNNEIRGLAIAVFSATVFNGPLLGPFIGGFILDSYLGWRWTQYLSAIMGFACVILLVLFLEESYPPVVLVSKAAQLRRQTKNWGIHAKQEEIEVDFRELISKNISRPFRILFTEPIVLLVSIYLSFIYGLLYLSLTAYEEIFEGVYGWNAGLAGLPYLGMVIGVMIGFGTIAAMNPSYARKLKANNNIPVPEWRLPITIPGGVCFGGGLLWLGWTGYQGSVPWIVPTLSGIMTGFGIYVVFLQMLNYIIDGYLMFAASAIAGNTFMRSLAGAGFPMFALYMFQGIGIEWTLTLLGCVALLLVPMPVAFLVYGKRIRAKSKIAPALDLKQDDEKRKKSDLESGGGSDPDASSSEQEKEERLEPVESSHE